MQRFIQLIKKNEQDQKVLREGMMKEKSHLLLAWLMPTTLVTDVFGSNTTYTDEQKLFHNTFSESECCMHSAHLSCLCASNLLQHLLLLPSKAPLGCCSAKNPKDYFFQLFQAATKHRARLFAAAHGRRQQSYDRNWKDRGSDQKKGKYFHCRDSQALEGLPKEAVPSSSLEVFKNWLDTALNNQVGLQISWGSFQTWLHLDSMSAHKKHSVLPQTMLLKVSHLLKSLWLTGSKH